MATSQHIIAKVLIAWLSISIVNAQTAEEAASQQAERLIQEQQLKREQEQRARESQRQQTPLREKQLAPVIPTESKQATCTQIKNIILKNATILSAAKQQKLITPYKNRCLNLSHINQLLAVITNEYFKQGYVTSRAYIAPQNTNDGTLTIIIIEGKINTLKSQQLTPRIINQAFPAEKGDTLNLRDLEQGIDQLNRLPSGQAKLKLLPGGKPGESNVDVSYQQYSSRWRISTSLDNSGQDNTGEDQIGLNLAYDNPFGLADNISLNAQTAIDAPEGSDTQNLSLHYDIPFGYWNLDIDLSQFDYKSRIEANNANTSGESENQSIKLSRLWYRDQQAKLGNRLTLKRKDNENFFEDTLIAGSSRTLASTSLETWYQRNIKNGFWSVNFFIDKGLDAFGGENDDNDSLGDTQAEFNKVRLNASYSKRLGKSGKLNYSANLFSQYSEDILNGADQISIGSQYTVRGYKQQGVSGNKGHYIRQEIRGYIPTGNWIQNHTGAWQLAFGLDWGKVREDDDTRPRYVELSGYGLKLRNSGKPLNISIEIAKAFNTPGFIDTDSTDIYISLNYRYSGKA